MAPTAFVAVAHPVRQTVWWEDIAPGSWWITNHVKEGRDALNFSECTGKGGEAGTRPRPSVAGRCRRNSSTWLGLHSNAASARQRRQLADGLTKSLRGGVRRWMTYGAASPHRTQPEAQRLWTGRPRSAPSNGGARVGCRGAGLRRVPEAARLRGDRPHRGDRRAVPVGVPDQLPPGRRPRDKWDTGPHVDRDPHSAGQSDRPGADVRVLRGRPLRPGPPHRLVGARRRHDAPDRPRGPPTSARSSTRTRGSPSSGTAGSSCIRPRSPGAACAAATATGRSRRRPTSDDGREPLPSRTPGPPPTPTCCWPPDRGDVDMER